jgi:hypothetical protein
MEEAQIRQRVRRLHETGEVPCDNVDGKLWAGRGSGDLCALCIEPIAPTEIEFEVELSSGAVLRVHRRCHQLWEEECGAVVRGG